MSSQNKVQQDVQRAHQQGLAGIDTSKMSYQDKQTAEAEWNRLKQEAAKKQNG